MRTTEKKTDRAAKTRKSPIWCARYPNFGSASAILLSDVMKNEESDTTSRPRNYVAQSRWRLIYKALKKEASDERGCISLRRFKSFGVLQQRTLDNVPATATGIWSQVFCNDISGFSLNIRELNQNPSASELIGFDNTGNVCVWPSEEILTYYCLKNASLFRSKSVCEVGGGMTCLAGFTVAQVSDAAEVVLTDGNKTSCQNAEIIATENKAGFGSTKVSVRKLLWHAKETFTDLKDKFDIVIGGDCFFFDEYRQDLADAIAYILKPGGMATMFAPHRGSTLKQFQKIAKQQFDTDLQEIYDQEVWKRHLKLTSAEDGDKFYNEDIHYPLLLNLIKR